MATDLKITYSNGFQEEVYFPNFDSAEHLETVLSGATSKLVRAVFTGSVSGFVNFDNVSRVENT